MTNYIFLPLIADKNTERFENHQYLLSVLQLFNKHRNFLVDDYYSDDTIEFITELINFINKLYPHFYVCLKNGEFIGFVYLDNWQGRYNNYHSCEITTCVDRKFWGKDSLKAGKQFLDTVFETYNLHKIKAEVFKDNHRVKNLLNRLGFKQEAVLKNETVKNGQYIDTILFSIIKEKI